jgi:hypothetical protein
MTFTVFGFHSGILDFPALQISAMKHKHSSHSQGQRRLMEGYAVNAKGHSLLEGRFGREFENFVLLNDVAIEACRGLGIGLGEQVGPFEVEELGDCATKFGPWEY